MYRSLRSAAVAASTTLLALTLAAAAAHAQQAPPAVIVVLDMEQVVTTSAAGKQAQTEIQGKLSTMQTRANALQGQLKTEADAIQKGQTDLTLAGTALETRVKAFGERQQAAQREIGQLENEIQRSRQYVLRQISDAVDPILTQVMRDKGANLALPRGATLQHGASVDVTAEVIARLNQSLPRVSTTPPAQAQPGGGR